MSTKPTSKPIAPVDLEAERAALGPALLEVATRVLESGTYILGPEVERFERDFAQRHDAAHGVGVGSGTDALILGLKALGVKAGDHVVTSPFTFFASAGAVAWIGAKPLLADVDPNTALLDPQNTAVAIDSKTTCILPVHLYGQLCDMRALRSLADEHGLSLLEDGAQAHGAERDGYLCGSLGDAAAFSFYPTKNLGAAGEGGMVVTNDNSIADRLRALRDHGSSEKYVHASIGTNSRLQALQGALLHLKLAYLDSWNDRRRELAARYDAAFEGHAAVAPLTMLGGLHARHQYTVRIRGEAGLRERVLEQLRAQQIFAAVHYPRPVHLQPVASDWGYGPGDFPVAEALSREVLCLPIHPFLSDSDVDRVSEGVLSAVQ